MTEEGVAASSLTHQGDTRGGADGQHRSTDAGGQRDQQPLAVGHFRIHRQYGKHDRNIVDDGRHKTDQYIGVSWPQADINTFRDQRQVADKAQTTDLHNDTIEEKQRIPLRLSHLGKDIEFIGVFDLIARWVEFTDAPVA